MREMRVQNGLVKMSQRKHDLQEEKTWEKHKFIMYMYS